MQQTPSTNTPSNEAGSATSPAVSPPRSFLALPPELRLNIYRHVVAGLTLPEPHDELTLAQDLSEFRELPILNVLHPPALARICRTFRAEYLPVLFSRGSFVIKTPFVRLSNSEKLAVQQDRSCRPINISPVTDYWLKNLDVSAGVHFRNVRFELSDGYGEPLGPRITLVFEPLARTYTAGISYAFAVPRKRQRIIGMVWRHFVTMVEENLPCDRLKRLWTADRLGEAVIYTLGTACEGGEEGVTWKVVKKLWEGCCGPEGGW